ncbi:hypothetical protein D3C85_1141120 [compost metagenome]
MAAGHERGRAGPVRAVASHHVADRVDRDLVEAALPHPVRNALRAGAVRIGQVRDSELAFLGVAGIAVRAESLLPVPDVIAQRGLTEVLVQAELGDAMKVAQRLFLFGPGRVVQPPREVVQKLAAVQFRAARSAQGGDGRKSETRCVVGVELCQTVGLFGAAVRQLRQLRLGAQERQPGVRTGGIHGLPQALTQVGDRAERTRLDGMRRHPGRVRVQAAEQGFRLGGRCGVELGKGVGHVRPGQLAGE